MNVGVVGNPNYPDLAAFLATLQQKATSVGITLYTDERIQTLLPAGNCGPRPPIAQPSGPLGKAGPPPPPRQAPGTLDCLIPLGADGTLLRGPRLLNGAEPPFSASTWGVSVSSPRRAPIRSTGPSTRLCAARIRPS